jgi:hypothetical protein
MPRDWGAEQLGEQHPPAAALALRERGGGTVTCCGAAACAAAAGGGAFAFWDEPGGLPDAVPLPCGCKAGVAAALAAAAQRRAKEPDPFASQQLPEPYRTGLTRDEAPPYVT